MTKPGKKIKYISKAQALIESVIDKAIEGGFSHINSVLKLLQSVDTLRSKLKPKKQPLRETDRQVITRYLERNKHLSEISLNSPNQINPFPDT